MTDVSILLQCFNVGKYFEKLFESFSELKQTAVSFFDIPKIERDILNFAFEYETTTLYIQDDEDLKYLNQIFYLLLKFESKKQHIIWFNSKFKEIFVETNKKKYL